MLQKGVMKATISADIVSSTSLETRQLMELRDRLLELFDRIAENNSGFWGRIVRGDSIECFVPDYHDVLRITLLVKLYVKMIVGQWDCSFLLQRYGIRFSIGIGDIHYADERDDIIDGPAIYISGRNLDAINRVRDVYSSIEVDRDTLKISYLLDSYVAMIDNMINSYSVKQAEVVYYKLWGYKETRIAEILGVRQSAVNSRSSLANWSLLARAINDFENFDFGKICG